MVAKLKANLKVPVTCKIRCLPSEADTLHLARAIEAAGASLLTVHGRTREHNKQTVGPANWCVIRRIKQELRIPVIANGGISDFADVERSLAFTGCDGVMSSESILEYPALFAGHELHDMDKLIMEYLEMYEKYPGEATAKHLKPHIHKFMHAGFVAQGHVDLRNRVNEVNLSKPENFELMKQIAIELAERRKDVPLIDKISWYYRHWKDSGDDAKEGLKNKEKMPTSFINDSEWNCWMLDDIRNPVSQKAKEAKEEDKMK